MGIQNHVRTLRSGIRRLYRYRVDDEGNHELLEKIDLGDEPEKKLYRKPIIDRVVATLQANSSILIIGGSGSGKTTVAEAVRDELVELGFLVVFVAPKTVKQCLLDIAEAFSIPTENLEGKKLTAAGLQAEISLWLQDNVGFLIIDNAHKQPPQFRSWLEDLHTQGQPMLLLATYPPARDIFLKLPRIELPPLSNKDIREIIKDSASELGLTLRAADIAAMQERCAGNPMLAKRVVREEYLGLEDMGPDHTQWFDITPILICCLMLLVITRFIGLGFNSTTLYLIGGIMTISVAIIRVLLASLPRSKGKLGQ